ncbi:MAG: hypothetical protein DKINENOH_04838 [bacterium]|nr:hypothetical protein [bacterium]
MSASDNFRVLRVALARWSDEHLGQARKFLAAHSEVIPRELGNAQLHGLANVARSATEYRQIEEFLAHQARKAERANKQKMQECWLALKVMWSALRDDAADIARPAKAPVDAVHCQLVRLFLQHLIAESVVLAASPQTGPRRSR